MRFKTNLKIKTGIIDPAPLVDIILQVVVFFVLAVYFIGRPGLALQLPSVGTPTLYKETTVKVSVGNEKLFFKEKEITKSQFKEELGKKLISVLVIEADKDVSHSRIIEIIDLAQQMGVSQIAIAADNKENTPR